MPRPFKRRAMAATVALSIGWMGAMPAADGAPIRGGTRTWVGNDSTSNWSNGGNWDGNDDIANGSTLIFNGSGRLSNINNLPNADNPLGGISVLSVNGLTFETGAGQFDISGKDIISTGNITNRSLNSQNMAIGVTIGSSQDWDGGSKGMSNTRLFTLDNGSLTLARNVKVRQEEGRDRLLVGWTGVASLTIKDGSLVQNRASSIGERAGLTGKAAVRGTGASWRMDEDLVVGGSGFGTLSIDDKGVVSSFEMTVGRAANSTGIVSVEGSGSSLSTAISLTIGDGGPGTLLAQSGARVSTGLLAIGTGATGTGTVTIQRGFVSTTDTSDSIIEPTILTAERIDVGIAGAGRLVIGDQAQVLASSVAIAYRPEGGTGRVDVGGEASFLSVTNDISIGSVAKGSLVVTGGGTVTASRLTLGNLGTVDLAGGTLAVGSVVASSGATFNWTSGTVRLTGAPIALGAGVPFLPGATTLVAGQALVVDGTLAIGGNRLLLAGGSVTANAITISGGSVATSSGQSIDMNRLGTLSGTGSVDARIVNGLGRTVRADGGPLSLGVVNLAGAYSFAGSLAVGSNRVTLLSLDKAQLGTSTTIGAGGQLASVNGINLSSGRSLAFNGNASILGNFTNNGAVSGTGGTLTFLNDVNGAGSFSGNVAFHAGYSPGNSPATVNHNGGDVTFDSTSLLTMEILGPTAGSQYDQLVGINKLTFNGRLSVVFGNGFAPTAHSNFRLFSFNSFAGSLAADRIDVTGFDRAQLDFSHLSQDGSFTVAAVPEPGTYAMFAAGLGLMGLMVRRRRQGLAA